jgi:diguanylate cyclase (GGDEF)-like protein/PAS domain S-box-containing protein
MFKLTDIVVILFITTLINILVTVVSLSRRGSRYGWYFSIGMMGVTLWTLAAMLDYAAVPLAWKVMFAKVEYLGYFSALTFLAIYTALFAGHAAWLRKTWVRLFFLLIPLSNLLLVWTNEWHGGIWSGFTPGRQGDNVVIFEHGPAFLWTTVSGYLLVLVIAASLLQVASTGVGILRRQARLLLLALAIPVAGNLFYLADVFNIPGVDLSSISFSIAGLFFLVALYGSRFMEIAPIARNTLIDKMADGVLVLDQDGSLVDFNPAAQTILGIQKKDLGRSCRHALADHPQIAALVEDSTHAVTREVVEGDSQVFEVSLTPLTHDHDETYGCLVVLRDISERKRMEQALRLSEEKFFTAFRSSPDAILISRLRDGCFVEVNDGFTRITGYTRQEALASSSLLLGFWTDLADRERVVTQLQQDRRVTDFELNFRVKSGRLLRCLYSGEIIQFGGEAHVLAVVRDITERARAEQVVKLRLGLWEFAGSHSMDELIRKALDEVGDLTGSPLGFCHIVDEDQNTIQLRAWSTRTLAQSGPGWDVDSHHPLDQAGVWADCARTHKPVIHNDYGSLPNRRGMPDGHVGIVRELVVPILRNERVVAIFGIGNKPSDYDEADVEVTGYIADVVWAIVDQKRADEQIRLLNSRLEQMAMTDDLTNLANRRAFFLRGSEAVKRSRRSNQPLSLLMLDVDHFKQVNDSRGHEAGDQVLKCTAVVLQQNVREVDILARLGGEEFALLLPDTGPGEAAVLAERLRQAVEVMTCPGLEGLHVTVSVGVTACRKDEMDLDEFMRVADAAMYRAKEQGRNRIVYLESPPA